MALGTDQTRTGQDRQMRRHGVLRDVEASGDIARCKAFGFMADQQPECLKSRGLRQCAQRGNRRFGFHISSIADITSRSEEHTSELQSLMRISYAVFCLKKKQKY